MARRGKLGFDLDGVLYPWHEIVLEELILAGGMPVGATVGSLFNYPSGIFHTFSPEVQDSILKNTRHYIRPFLREGAYEVLDTLRWDWDIFYITSRPHEAESPTKAWIRAMGLPYRDHVYVVNGGKRDMAELLGLDVFIDDRASHVDELHDICAVVLLTRPWNKNYNKNEHVRIDQLHELIPLLEGGLDANHNRRTRD